MTNSAPQETTRFERTLAYMMLAIVLLAVGSFIAIMVGTGTGMGSQDFAGGIWPVVVYIPWFGLPIAFVMLIVLIISSAVRRSRQNRK